MSVLIKGMDMPESCAKCQLLEGDSFDGLCHGAAKWLDDDYFRWFVYDEGDIDDSKPLNCPLGEIPTPHGRLIDADRLFKVIITTLEFIKENPKMDGQEAHLISAFHVLGEMVNDAPTIIEAED